VTVGPLSVTVEVDVADLCLEPDPWRMFGVFNPLTGQQRPWGCHVRFAAHTNDEMRQLDATRDALRDRLLRVVRALIQVEDRRADLLLRLVERDHDLADSGRQRRARDARSNADDLTAILVAVERLSPRPTTTGPPLPRLAADPIP
jgi:hypothetical protein